jgi:hypothetical protein
MKEKIMIDLDMEIMAISINNKYNQIEKIIINHLITQEIHIFVDIKIQMKIIKKNIMNIIRETLTGNIKIINKIKTNIMNKK